MVDGGDEMTTNSDAATNTATKTYQYLRIAIVGVVAALAASVTLNPRRTKRRTSVARNSLSSSTMSRSTVLAFF